MNAMKQNRKRLVFGRDWHGWVVMCAGKIVAHRLGRESPLGNLCEGGERAVRVKLVLIDEPKRKRVKR